MSRLSLNLNNPNGHVTLSTFGLTRSSGGESRIDHLIRTLGVVRPVVAEILTRKAYMEDYDLMTPKELEDNMSVVLHTDKINIVEGGARRSWTRKYFNNGILQNFGLNLNEFFASNYTDVKFMIELSESHDPMKGLPKLD